MQQLGGETGHIVKANMRKSVLELVDVLPGLCLNWIKVLAKEGKSDAMCALPASRKALLDGPSFEMIQMFAIFKEVSAYDKKLWNSSDDVATGFQCLHQAVTLVEFKNDVAEVFQGDPQQLVDKIKTAAVNTIKASAVSVKKIKEHVTPDWDKMKVIDDKIGSWDFTGLDWMFKNDPAVDAMAAKLQSSYHLS